MKKTLKVVGVVALCFLTFILIAGIYLFRQLPSVSKIASSFVEPKASIEKEVGPGLSQVEPDKEIVKTQEDKVEKKEFVDEKKQTEKMNQALFEDMTSVQKPLSDFCVTLKNAEDGSFNEKELGQAFNESVLVDPNDDKRDPRIQALKPVLRYALRLPKLSDLVKEVKQADESHEEDIFEKAEFYTKAISAFAEMKEHKTDIESVMDRSYLLLGLNKLVASQPKLLNEFKLQNYCNDIETAFNQATPVDFESEKKNFIKFLADLNVKPQDIGFDESYKSDINFKFSKKAMTFEGGWLNEIIEEDTVIE